MFKGFGDISHIVSAGLVDIVCCLTSLYQYSIIDTVRCLIGSTGNTYTVNHQQVAARYCIMYSESEWTETLLDEQMNRGK